MARFKQYLSEDKKLIQSLSKATIKFNDAIDNAVSMIEDNAEADPKNKKLQSLSIAINNAYDDIHLAIMKFENVLRKYK